MNSPTPPELDLQEILRLRRAAMHQMVDDQVDQLMLELGLQPPKTHTLGMSFEPTVLFEYIPQDGQGTDLGFYKVRRERTVEVVQAGPTAGKVYFEIVDRLGQIAMRSMDEELFHCLFRLCEGPEQPSPAVRYGLHPVYKSIALRYNADGSITQGRFGDQGEFIERA